MIFVLRISFQGGLHATSFYQQSHRNRARTKVTMGFRYGSALHYCGARTKSFTHSSVTIRSVSLCRSATTQGSRSLSGYGTDGEGTNLSPLDYLR